MQHIECCGTQNTATFAILKFKLGRLLLCTHLTMLCSSTCLKSGSFRANARDRSQQLTTHNNLNSLQGSKTMAVEKVNSSSSLAEVVDRILDKGIVVDAWVRVSLVGIELLAIEARIVIASVDTYLKYAEAVGLTAQAAVPAV